jgi:hypothetical protein
MIEKLLDILDMTKQKVSFMKQSRQINVHLDSELVAGLDVLYDRMKITKTAAVTIAVSKLLKDYDIQVEKPKAD